jgi:hypothetical protein
MPSNEEVLQQLSLKMEIVKKQQQIHQLSRSLLSHRKS